MNCSRKERRQVPTIPAANGIRFLLIAIIKMGTFTAVANSIMSFNRWFCLRNEKDCEKFRSALN